MRRICGQMPLLVLVGLLDVCGSGLFAVSSALGRLDIAAVITSLYPAVTVLLARTVLSEEINGRQWAGIALAAPVQNSPVAPAVMMAIKVSFTFLAILASCSTPASVTAATKV